MKVRAYLRIAKTKARKGYRIAVATNPTEGSLLDSYGAPLPTIAFAIDLDIPDVLFSQASAVIAELVVPENLASLAVEGIAPKVVEAS